jgi:hypothetical protein
MHKYYKCGYFYNGYALIKFNDKFGILNDENIQICEIKYETIWYDKDIDLFLVRLNIKYGFIDTSGNLVIEIKYAFDEINNILKQYLKNKERNLKLNKLV